MQRAKAPKKKKKNPAQEIDRKLKKKCPTPTSTFINGQSPGYSDALTQLEIEDQILYPRARLLGPL